MKKLTVNFSEAVGAIKPMHGVNNGPMTCNFSQDSTPWFLEAGIPFSRLHDTEYPFGSGEYVDVGCIFKNFNDDENDPKNYNFALTDEYLKAIKNAGAKTIYRLGCTIEHQPVKVHIIPPKDPIKWARICEHIIRHVNEGWGDGMHLGIERWEIWNEPEGKTNMWTGTPEEFYELYTVTAKHLKACFPNLMIGGPAFTSARNPFIEGFFAYIRDHKAPLDFYSWHRYAKEPVEVAQEAAKADAILKEYGYEGAESICDEWNYVRTWENVYPTYQMIRTHVGAAFDAAVMCDCQHSPCDILTFYDAQGRMCGSWNGLFDLGIMTVHGKPAVMNKRKGFYSFKAFGELYRLGTEVKAEIGEGSLHVCAAKGDNGKAVLIANFKDEDCPAEKVRLSFDDKDAEFDLYHLDKNNDFVKTATVRSGSLISMQPQSVVFLTTAKAE